DAICHQGLARATRSLRRAFDDGRDKAAREDMALASVFGGLALANAGLGAVHGFAAPIGGKFNAPHGAVCAALLPEVMEVNILALRQRQPDAKALVRYAEAAQLLTGSPQAKPEDGVTWVRELRRRLAVPGLGTYGIGAADQAALCAGAAVA